MTAHAWSELSRVAQRLALGAGAWLESEKRWEVRVMHSFAHPGECCGCLEHRYAVVGSFWQRSAAAALAVSMNYPGVRETAGIWHSVADRHSQWLRGSREVPSVLLCPGGSDAVAAAAAGRVCCALMEPAARSASADGPGETGAEK